MREQPNNVWGAGILGRGSRSRYPVSAECADGAAFCMVVRLLSHYSQRAPTRATGSIRRGGEHLRQYE
jgi:hypothetical protein